MVVPEVERVLSSRRVLTTTWLAGVKLQNRELLERNQLDPTTWCGPG